MDFKVSLDSNNEILLKNERVKIYLDPSKITNEDLVFISHAHTDHLLNKKHIKKYNLKNKIISSPETTAFANSKGYDLSNIYFSLKLNLTKLLKD